MIRTMSLGLSGLARPGERATRKRIVTLGSYRGSYRRLEEAVFGPGQPEKPSPQVGIENSTNVRSHALTLSLSHSLALRARSFVRQVTLFLSDGTVTTTSINAGITGPLGLDMPTIEGDRELEISSELGVEALWLASYGLIGWPDRQALSLALRSFVRYFRVAATNGIDATRRLWIEGFYRDIEYLAESVHRSIATRGGEINSIVLEKDAAGQPLVMNVVVPFLFGVPAERARLTDGIERGGGIIHSEILKLYVGL